MVRVKRAALAFLVGATLLIPAGMVGRALDFGGLAWLGMFVLVLLAASLFDREGFYGPRDSG